MCCFLNDYNSKIQEHHVKFNWKGAWIGKHYSKWLLIQYHKWIKIFQHYFTIQLSKTWWNQQIKYFVEDPIWKRNLKIIMISNRNRNTVHIYFGRENAMRFFLFVNIWIPMENILNQRRKKWIRDQNIKFKHPLNFPIMRHRNQTIILFSTCIYWDVFVQQAPEAQLFWKGSPSGKNAIMNWLWCDRSKNEFTITRYLYKCI